MNNVNTSDLVVLCLYLLLFGSLLTSCDKTGSVETAPTKTVMVKDTNISNSQRNPYFGDLHVHSSYSLDSYINFNPVSPREAYEFAQGEEVHLSGGRKLKLGQALDFAAVTEHAEYLGELALCLDNETAEYDLALCQTLRNEKRELGLIGQIFKTLLFKDSTSALPMRDKNLCQGGNCINRAHDIWLELQEIANDYNKPGQFTTFIAYEWSGNTNGNNLHRNIIFRNKHVPSSPSSYFEANTPVELLRQLSQNCKEPCDVISIPHNSNQSNGQQFPIIDETAAALEFAELRSKYEPLVEIIQAKGASECHIGFGTADEFCNFENIERRAACRGDSSIDKVNCAKLCDAGGKPKGCVWANNYIRNALKHGLLSAQKLGTNPYKFGLIGSTDTHNGTPGATDESNYTGHHGVEDGTAETRRAMPTIKFFTPQRMKGSGGLAGVWAEENTRDSLFDAFKRKETFGTSGTRIVVRFFAAWQFPKLLTKQHDLVILGYESGVPMGSDLPPMPTAVSSEKAVPQFLVWAMKGNDGLNIQRLQIIKGWLDDGRSHEKTFDVACADGLEVNSQSHRCPDNGAEVNLEDCSVSAGKGAIELKTVWQDPDFDPNQRAFYYLRVLENPSCRWSSYEALREGKRMFDELESTIQERAWSSPIWYKPS